jgi:hypothetical protein
MSFNGLGDAAISSYDAENVITANWDGSGGWTSVADLQDTQSLADPDTGTESGWITENDGNTTVLSEDVGPEDIDSTYNESYASETAPVCYTDDYTQYNTIIASGDTSTAFSSINEESTSSYGSWGGSSVEPYGEFGDFGGVAEYATSTGLLDEIEQVPADEMVAAYTGGSLYLAELVGGVVDGGTIPRSVRAELSGSTLNLAVAPRGEYIPSVRIFGFVPSTNAMTAHGLPIEKADDLSDLALNYGPTDGVSQTATSPPTSVLVTLAAAGRKPDRHIDPHPGGHRGLGWRGRRG